MDKGWDGKDFEATSQPIEGWSAGDCVKVTYEGEYEYPASYGFIRHFERYGKSWYAYIVEKGDDSLDDYAGGGIEPLFRLEPVGEIQRFAMAQRQFEKAIKGVLFPPIERLLDWLSARLRASLHR